MRKLLISILIALLLLITIYSVVKGLSIGNIKILGFNNIRSESENLDSQIAEITKLKEQDYKKTLSDIESNAKVLLQEKEKYATLVSTSTDSEIEKATHAQNYEQDFLWAKIGNHATAQGVQLKFDIAVGAVNKENYDLHFTVSGNYTNITEFVRALEDDNLLGFKIENFKLVPGGSVVSTTTTTNKNNNTTNTTTNTMEDNTTSNTNTTNNNKNTDSADEKNNSTSGEATSMALQATFKVTDIGINIDKSKIISSSSSETSSVEEKTKTNNTTSSNTTVEGTTED